MKKSLSPLLLSIIPVGLLVYGAVMVKCIFKYYISWPDPAYAYLFNGLNLASGHITLGHVDHPGTPVQCFTALMIRVIHFFSGDGPLVTDVLADPEMYLAPIGYSVSLLMGLTTFFAGYRIYKCSHRLWTGLLFQLIPLAAYEIVFMSANLMTEPFLVAGTMLLLTHAYIYVSNTSESRTGMKHYMVFGLLIGFIIAVKISALPLLFVPFILLSKWKNKILYLLFTIIFFLLFIAPAFNDLNRFTDFISGIWNHTGNYGMGQKGLIDIEKFKQNLLLIFTSEWSFSFSYISIVLSCFYLIYRNNHKDCFKSRTFRLLAGSWIAMTLQILIVAKHYSSHYLFPAYCLIVPGIYYSFKSVKIFSDSLKNTTEKWKEIALVLIAVVLFSRDFIRTDFVAFEKMPDATTFNVLKKYPNTAKIILTANSAATIPEPALYFGLAYSGGQKQIYTNALKSLYPDSYFFSPSGAYFYSWQDGQEFILKDILFRNPKIIIYVDKNAGYAEKILLDKLKTIELKTGSVSVEKIFQNSENGICIYEIATNCNKLDYQLVIEKDIKDTSKNLTLGVKSIQLTSANEFSMQTSLVARPGHFYEISVWKKSANNNLALVATSIDGKFYKSAITGVNKRGKWDQIKLSFELPLSFSQDSINIYVWNIKNDIVYVDDLRIKEWSY